MDNYDTQRRLFGTLLGAFLGMLFMGVIEFTPLVQMRDIPLYARLYGPWGNTLISALVGGVFGLITAWWREGALGVIAAAAGAAVLLVASSLVNASGLAVTGFSLVGLALLLPVTGLLAPLAIALRWAVNTWITDRIDGFSLKAWRLPLILVLLTALVAAANLEPASSQVELRRMQALIQAGLAAASNPGSLPEALPEPLRSKRVGSFTELASQSYTLEWEDDNINRFAIPRYGTDKPWEEAVVIARFDSGWTLVCLYPSAEETPECDGIDE